MNGARSFLDKGAAKTRIENVIFLLPNDFDTDGYDSCGRKKQAAAAGIRSGEKNRSCWTARQFSVLLCTWDNP